MHAIATTYPASSGLRAAARVRVSPRLPVDARTMSGAEMTAVLRDALVELSGLRYIDRYAMVDKRRAAEAEGRTEDLTGLSVAGGPDDGVGCPHNSIPGELGGTPG